MGEGSSMRRKEEREGETEIGSEKMRAEGDVGATSFKK